MIRQVPNEQQWQRAATQVPGVAERLFWPLYSRKAYAALGQTQLTFFGETTATAPNALDDTNMEAAGQMPGGKPYYIEEICVDMLPGILPGQGGLASAGTGVPDFINDVYTFGKGGNLQVVVNSKQYLVDAPLMKFPPRTRIAGHAALSDATTAATALETLVDYAAITGAPYATAGILVAAQVPFSVTMNWKAALALPSGAAASVFVTLNGWQQRAAQ